MVAVAEKNESVIEVEIDGPRNESCIFRPLQRRIRGRFDLRRIAEPAAMMRHPEHPDAIPGQRLRLNTATRRFEIIEPLNLPEFAAVRERYEINKRGEKTSMFPKDEAIEGVDVPTFLFWLATEVKAGHAKILAGTLPDPDAIEGKVRRNFYTAPSKKKASDDTIAGAMKSMADAVTANTAVMVELLKRMTGGK